eukprot:TRINITY_DN109748_c0_g1_i1.p1 TRINITY_DN109748_c0_g1~~TRINITY_DN109748_c0_g1_i1.p1  ORF type:complete len:278 (-),score=46.84 TRINITY_DN109748_c0_g1_i1:102-935(-)
MGTEYENNFIAYDWSRMSDARLTTPPGSRGRAASLSSSASAKKGGGRAELPSNCNNNLHARLKGDALATICPPWSTPTCSYVREQPTTLKYRLTRVSEGLAQAQEKLERRRLQPTYADHGLSFRMNNQEPGLAKSSSSRGDGAGSSSSQAASRSRARREGSKKTSASQPAIPTSPAARVMQPEPGAESVKHKPMKHPLWWGQAALPPEPDRSTYEDLGEYFPRQATTIAGKEMLRADSMPMLYGKYKHDNPFLGTGAPYRRGPGGVVVCDVSLAPKP